ncbi:MAG: MltA domain-containing protein [Aquabacterium sp.]|nr:MltA domain-containing protein [Aquabacterium sp.]
MRTDLQPAPALLVPFRRWALAAGCCLAVSACSLWREGRSPDVPEAPASPTSVSARAATVALDTVAKDITTRHALFKVSSFDALPGWQQDNMGDAWGAFKASCKALERKANWKPLCAQVHAIKSPQDGRALLEREFTLLAVQNTDRTRDGDITGYYEPLLSGQMQRGGNFVVPVYGVPNDLYILDWKGLPLAQRQGVAQVSVGGGANGRLLVAAQPGQSGVIRVDLRKFTLDTLDRRLRVRLQGREGLPYYDRADILSQQAFDAPILAWVDDAVALYAMQVQGAGRIRLPDGRILRLQYADQNGHPFKPMQLAAQGRERVQTRGRADAAPDATDDIEQFDLLDALPEPSVDEPLTRGARKPSAVGQLSPQNLLNDLLSQRSRVLNSDPSYVFFRVAPDQSSQSGPVGALGVPLTAGRSLAVDPRVLPLGYPVFLDATVGGARQPPLQRLMFAQDTGGAIRGAVRADYFWGFGADAGRQARRTKHKGRMWVLVPRIEVAALLSSKLVTRGGRSGVDQPECLIDDEVFCDNP